ncbi:GDSL-type esterase/lipase family protein [Roseateles sp.]|uniref:GDSL-type esterase/lipase family protein n=1 Tax=Roseateles sp. TaxID=1971397 RepID=UPI0031DA6C58
MGVLEKVAGLYTARPTASVKSGGSYGQSFVTNLPTLTGWVVTGDSIAWGSAAVPDTPELSWVNRAAAHLGVPILNSAVSGTVLQNSPGSGGTALSQNGLDNVVTRMLGANKREGGIVAYGFNDMRYTGAPATFNVTTFIDCYRKYLNILIEGGYIPSKLLLVSPYYITDSGLASGSAGFQGQSRANVLQFVAAVAQLAAEYGTYYVDMYQFMLANGAATLISADNIHPNATPGHATIENGIHTATVTNTRTKPTLTVVSPSANTLNWSFPAVSGATGYTVEYQLTGGYSGLYTGTVTGTALSGQFTGLTPGQYIVRAKATTAAGDSPWTFSQKVAVAAPAQTGAVFEASFTGAADAALSGIDPVTGSRMVAATSYTGDVALDGSGGCYSKTANQGVMRTQDAVSAMPYVLEFDLKKVTTISTDNNGVIFHAQAAANTHYFIRYNQPTGAWQLYRNTASNPVKLGSDVAQSFTDGTSKSCKVTVSDAGGGQTRILFEVAGATVIDFTDTTPLAFSGYAGMRLAGANTATTGCHMTKLKLYTP